MQKLRKENIHKKNILVEDSFGTDDSKKQIAQLKARVKEAVGDVLKLVKRASKVDMVIRLCGPIGDESHYLQSMERMSGSSSIAVQHMIHHGGGKDDGVSKAMAT